MTDQSSEPQHLPRDLRAAVGEVIGILGEVITEAEGEALFEVVESIRQQMVALRDSEDTAERQAILARAAERLAELSPEDKRRVARAYTLYLELVNVCENAYRSHRLVDRGRRDVGPGRAQLTFVLTAHPTESRSPENIRLLRRAQDMITRCLHEDRAVDRAELGNLLHLAWGGGAPPHASRRWRTRRAICSRCSPIPSWVRSRGSRVVGTACAFAPGWAATRMATPA